MDLLERYLRQIKRYLPQKDQEETIKELRSLILDQVDEHTNQDQETALKDILIEMGPPQDVALRYNDRGPLISRQLEPIMKLIMKITSITLPLAILFAESIAFVTREPDFTFMEFLLQITYSIPSAIYSLVVAIGMIFIVFVLIERYASPNFSVEEKPFNPELLPELPQKAFHVSVFGSIVSILVLTLILYLFNLQPGLIRIYFDGTSIPLLNENFDNIIPFLNIGWFVSILIHVYYLYTRKKNITSKTIEFIVSVYSGVIMILIATSDVFNIDVISEYNLDIIPNMITYIFLFIGVAAIIGALVDYIKMFINLDKLSEELDKK